MQEFKFKRRGSFTSEYQTIGKTFLSFVQPVTLKLANACGSTNISKKGESVFRYSLSDIFSALNVGFRNRPLLLDLTINPKFLSSNITISMLSTNASCSEHRYIEFVIEMDLKPVEQFHDKRRLDVKKFKQFLEVHLQNGITTIKNLCRIDSIEIKIWIT